MLNSSLLAFGLLTSEPAFAGPPTVPTADEMAAQYSNSVPEERVEAVELGERTELSRSELDLALMADELFDYGVRNSACRLRSTELLMNPNEEVRLILGNTAPVVIVEFDSYLGKDDFQRASRCMHTVEGGLSLGTSFETGLLWQTCMDPLYYIQIDESEPVPAEVQMKGSNEALDAEEIDPSAKGLQRGPRM